MKCSPKGAKAAIEADEDDSELDGLSMAYEFGSRSGARRSRRSMLALAGIPVYRTIPKRRSYGVEALTECIRLLEFSGDDTMDLYDLLLIWHYFSLHWFDMGYYYMGTSSLNCQIQRL